jgi:hypothetical protein
MDGVTLNKIWPTQKDQVVKARFTLGVRAYVQLKSSIPIGAKVEISPPKGFTLGVKTELEKIFFQSAQMLNFIYGLVVAPRLGKWTPSNLGGPIYNPLGPMFPHLLNSVHSWGGGGY